ncbi:uncharacterized protein [Miscanthus floridulus]|uniref:uncharacterized protein n=1 Tax=Miscanthus floridulus TaxID=154761 RepID=UPI00345888B7
MEATRAKIAALRKDVSRAREMEAYLDAAKKEVESIKAGSFQFMTSMESIVLSAVYAQLNITFVQQGQPAARAGAHGAGACRGGQPRAAGGGKQTRGRRRRASLTAACASGLGGTLGWARCGGGSPAWGAPGSRAAGLGVLGGGGVLCGGRRRGRAGEPRGRAARLGSSGRGRAGAARRWGCLGLFAPALSRRSRSRAGGCSGEGARVRGGAASGCSGRGLAGVGALGSRAPGWGLLGGRGARGRGLAVGAPARRSGTGALAGRGGRRRRDRAGG